jgi:hypothetical protein
MKTKDFIKMLQEADPSGEMHIRMSDGIPFAAEPKPGYWDGPYSYIDDEKNWVYSTEGGKVDIHCMEIYDFVDNMFGSGSYNLPTWEEVSSKFRFELNYSNGKNEEKIEYILKEAKETYNEKIEWRQKLKSDGIERARTQVKSGWTWFQNKLADDDSIRPNIHRYYTWKIYDGEGKEECSNLHNVEAILHSGLFEKHDNGVLEGHYQWILKSK